MRLIGCDKIDLKDIEISWKDRLWRRMEWKEPDWHFIVKFIFILDVSHDHTKMNDRDFKRSDKNEIRRMMGFESESNRLV